MYVRVIFLVDIAILICYAFSGKRVKFQFFEKGTCWKKQCSLAHEEEYTNLIPFTRLKQKDGGPPPKPFIPKKSEDPRRGDDDDLYDELGLLR